MAKNDKKMYHDSWARVVSCGTVNMRICRDIYKGHSWKRRAVLAGLRRSVSVPTPRLWWWACPSVLCVGKASFSKELFDLVLGRKEEEGEPFLHLLFLKCFQPKIINMPKRNTLGQRVWIPLPANTISNTPRLTPSYTIININSHTKSLLTSVSLIQLKMSNWQHKKWQGLLKGKKNLLKKKSKYQTKKDVTMTLIIQERDFKITESYVTSRNKKTRQHVRTGG